MLRGIPLLDKGAGREVLKKHCRTAGISVLLIEQLIDEELHQQGKARRHGLYENFDRILEEAAQEGVEEEANAASVSRSS